MVASQSQEYIHEPPTLVELKDVVNEEVTAIDGELLEQVKGNDLKGLETCNQESVRQLPDVVL